MAAEAVKNSRTLFGFPRCGLCGRARRFWQKVDRVAAIDPVHFDLKMHATCLKTWANAYAAGFNEGMKLAQRMGDITKEQSVGEASLH